MKEVTEKLNEPSTCCPKDNIKRDNPNSSKDEKKASSLGFLLSKIGKHKFKLFASCTLSVLSALLNFSPYFLMQAILASLIDGKVDNSLLSKLIIWTSGLIVASVVLNFFAFAFSHITAFSILHELRIKTIEHLGRVNLGFFRANSSGEVKKALDEDVQKLEIFLAHQIPDLAESIIAPLVMLIFLMTIKWYLALLLLVPFILVILIQSQLFKGYSKKIASYNELKKRLHTTIVEYVNGIKIFKAFNLTARRFKNYSSVVNEHLDTWVGMCDSQIKPYTIGVCIVDSSSLFILIPLGGFLFMKGELLGSSFVMFLLLGSVFLQSFLKLLMFGENLSMLLIGAENVRKILETPSQKSGNIKLDERKAKEDIEFKNVNFKYKDKYVIKNLSLSLKAGTVTALVGHSGSGKTTLATLIGRFYDIDDGGIYIGENNIKDFTIDSLLSQMSFVFQDVFILNDSVLNNVKLGLDKTEEEIKEACKKAQIHEFIMNLQEGYNTVIGEGSPVKLSGGEMQRISIARCFLKNAPIVVLDEITSYSDIENEVEIQKALSTLLKDKTSLIIAHRLYTIKNADNIVVLNEGEIAEMGKHAFLLEKDGLYKKMWMREID